MARRRGAVIGFAFAIGAIGAIGALGGVAGCSLFTSLNGFSNGDDDSPKQNSGSSEGGGGPDGSGVINDGGGSSSGNPPVDANTPFCTSSRGSSATFCADFDRVSKFNDGWTNEDIDPASSLAFAESKLTSSPRSLRVTMPAKGQGTFYALITKRLTTSTRRALRVELDLFVTPPMWNGTGNVSFFSLGYSGPQLDVSQELFLNSDDTSALTTQLKSEEPNNFEFSPNTIALPRNQWVHVKVETDFKTSGGYVRIWFNNQQVVNKLNTNYQAGDHDFAYLNVGFGRYNNGSTPAFEAFYDNVIIEFY